MLLTKLQFNKTFNLQTTQQNVTKRYKTFNDRTKLRNVFLSKISELVSSESSLRQSWLHFQKKPFSK
jgi:hypothetical protein